MNLDQKLTKKIDFLRKLSELMQEFQAEFSIELDFKSKITIIRTLEIYINRSDDLCGTANNGLSVEQVERMLNCATETLSELDTPARSG